MQDARRKTRRKDILLGLGLVGAILLVVTLLEVGGIMAGMRDPAQTPQQIPNILSGGTAQAELVVDQWKEWHCRTVAGAYPDNCDDRAFSNQSIYTSPGVVLLIYFALDMIFIGVYVFLLWRLIAWMKSRASTAIGKWGKWFTRAKWLVGILAIVDAAENISFVIAYHVTPGVAAVGKWVHLAKNWLVIGVFLGTLYMLFFAPDPSAGTRLKRFSDILRGLVAVRGPLIVSVIGVVFLLGYMPSVGEQIPDVIRSWNWLHLVTTAYITLLFAVTAWLIADRTYARVVGPAQRPGKDQATMTESVGRDLMLRKTAAAVVFISAVIGWAWKGTTAGLGLLVPAAIVAIVWLLGRPLREKKVGMLHSEHASRGRNIPAGLPAGIGAGFIVLVGVSLYRASLVDVVLFGESLGILGVFAVGSVLFAIVIWVASRLVRELEANGNRVTAVAVVVLLIAPLAYVFREPLEALALFSSTLFSTGIAFCLAGLAFYFFAHGARRWHDHREIPATDRFLELFGRDQTNNVSAWDRRAIRITLLGSAVVAWMVFGSIFDRIVFPRRIGAVTVLLVFLLVVLALTYAGTVYAEHTQAPVFLSRIGFDRTPVFLFIVAWIAIASSVTLFKGDDFHDVRVLEPGESIVAVPIADTCPDDDQASDPITPGITLEALVDRWQCRTGGPGTDGAVINAYGALDEDERLPTVRPAVFISAWGGGIRAAVWTAAVMDCVFEPGTTIPGCDVPAGDDRFARSDTIVAASGVSGGHLGLSEYTAYILDQSGETPTLSATSWIRDRLHEDFLSPALARLLFVDIPGSMIGFSDAIDDRADISEESWEYTWRVDDEPGLLEVGLFEAWDANEHVPLIIANGTSISDLCNLNGSVLAASIPSANEAVADDCTSLNPFIANRTGGGGLAANHDLADFMCVEGTEMSDVRLSTSSMLSARFAYISPSGRLIDDCEEAEEYETIYVIDGGYLEGSGSLTITQVWESVDPLLPPFDESNQCIVPVMIHMENGYQPPGPQQVAPSSPNEWTVPIDNAGAKRGLEQTARARAALEFSSAMVGPNGERMFLVDQDGAVVDRYAFVTTRSHPGISAPLGWALSNSSFDDLVFSQLERNQDEIDTTQQWFSEGVYCATFQYWYDGENLYRTTVEPNTGHVVRRDILTNDGWMFAETLDGALIGDEEARELLITGPGDVDDAWVLVP